MIVIIGDTHGGDRMGSSNALKNPQMKRICESYDREFPDYVIVVGDFGYVWSADPNNKEELYWLRWLSEKPYKILFVDGNHENHERLSLLESVDMFGADVGKVRDNIFHLRRGRIYTIENKKFFAFGGAMSVDKEWRIDRVSWWKEEEPTYAECAIALENLEKAGNTVDIVLTHTAPKTILETFAEKYLIATDRIQEDSVARFLDEVYRRTEFKNWFFGHFHTPWTHESFQCLYGSSIAIL